MDNTKILSQDKFPRLPIDQKVNFCNCSAEPKYVSTLTIALAKLLNINPTINIVAVSRNRLDTRIIKSKTKVKPKKINFLFKKPDHPEGT